MNGLVLHGSALAAVGEQLELCEIKQSAYLANVLHCMLLGGLLRADCSVDVQASPNTMGDSCNVAHQE